MEKFVHPFTCIVAGATGSGKTWLVRKLLANHELVMEGLSKKPRILWTFGIGQQLHREPVPNCETLYEEGLDHDKLQRIKPDILVIDDLMQEQASEPLLAQLFTRGSHHLSMTVIFIVQNIFMKGSEMRTISLNAKYIILMKNPRDKSQVYALGRQLFPENLTYFRDSYLDATKQGYGYLVIDLTQNCDDSHRLRTDIFKSHPTFGYIPTFYAPK